MGAPRFVLDRFWPSNLFLGGIPGAWYDPTDLSTMFQDSTGTTPVTAVEQPVGLILDKSGNGNHASQSTAASRPTYRARYNALTQSEDFSQAVWTKVNANVSANSVTAPDGTTTADTLTPTAVLGYHLIIQAVAVTNGAAYTFSYYVRPNGYTKIALVENQTTGNFVTFDLTGAGSVITASGAVGTIASVGGGWYRVTHTSNAGSGTFRPDLWVLPNSYVSGSFFFTWTPDGTSGVYVWGAQLLTAADVTATGNAYQRIAAATVYDTAPVFRPYLAFDGLDDSLSTAAINFTSTDKMSVFSGVTKLSDAALGNVIELGNRNLVQAGSFTLIAPRSAGNPNYAFIVEGTAATDNTITGYPAPITSVMTGRADISAPLNQLRVNGAVAGTLTTTLGTGNFGTWPLFIGRRNNASLPLNGRLYSLIVRGAASSVTEIADTELWVNARTGAY